MRVIFGFKVSQTTPLKLSPNQILRALGVLNASIDLAEAPAARHSSSIRRRAAAAAAIVHHTHSDRQQRASMAKQSRRSGFAAFADKMCISRQLTPRPDVSTLIGAPCGCACSDAPSTVCGAGGACVMSAAAGCLSVASTQACRHAWANKSFSHSLMASRQAQRGLGAPVVGRNSVVWWYVITHGACIQWHAAWCSNSLHSQHLD